MARLSDIPKVYRSVGLIAFARRVMDETARDNLLVWASALAYSWLFAMFPFFIFLLALMPHLPLHAGQPAIHQIIHMTADLLPSVADTMIFHDVVENPNSIINQQAVNGPALWIGLALALWAASGGTSATMAALDRCYELERGRGYIQHHFVAIVMTISVMSLLIALTLIWPPAREMKAWIVARTPHALVYPLVIVTTLLRFAVELFFLFLVLGIVYHNGPAIRQRLHILTPGAVFVIVVWGIMGLLFRYYVNTIGAAGYSKTYGTVSGVAILMFFFYIDATVLLVGAEINAEVDYEILRVRRGSRDFRKCEDLSEGSPTSC